jgi:hypothetical protein
VTTTIDDLLAQAALVTTPAAAFDVGAALRRLAADAAKAAVPAPSDMQRAAEARQRLAVVSRWILNEPGAADHVEGLVNDQSTALMEEHLDVEGAAVFACLLYLTNHPESAQFWWQLAAGAGYRPAAYCLHLHHLALGEKREAQHWRHQVTHTVTEGGTPDDIFLTSLGAFANYVRQNGSTASGPTGGLEMEIDRLAEGNTNTNCIIIRRPDQRLADRLADFTRR